jgi:hypothetical protein
MVDPVEGGVVVVVVVGVVGVGAGMVGAIDSLEAI